MYNFQLRFPFNTQNNAQSWKYLVFRKSKTVWWAGWPRHFLWLPEWELLGKTAREMPSMWAPKQPSLPGSYQGGEILVIRHPGQTRGEEHNLGPLNMTQLASQAATKASICSGWRLNRQKEIRVRLIDSSPRGCLSSVPQEFHHCSQTCSQHSPQQL